MTTLLNSSFILLPLPPVVTAKCEPSIADAKPELRYQFARLAYFALNPNSQPGELAGQADAGRRLVFNRTITLKDTWAKEVRKGG